MNKGMKKLTFECSEQLARCLKSRALNEDQTQQQLILNAVKSYMNPVCDDCELCQGRGTKSP